MLLKLNKRSFAVKNQNFLSNIYQKLKFGELTNSYMILYLSQFDMLVNNSDRLFGLAQRAMGRRLFFYMLGNTVGKHFTGGENLEQVKMVCNKLSANNINMAVNYLAEFIEERECDEFFDQNCERYLKTCELNDQDKDYEFFNAIKLSGMVRFAHLKRFNENQERLEELFMDNDNLQQNDKGYYLERSDLIESIQSVNSSLRKEDIDSFIDLIKLNEESDRVYYVEWRLNCGFTNIHNKSVQDHPIYRTLSPFNVEESESLQKLINRITTISDKAKETNCYILVDAEQSYLQLAIYNIVEQLMHIYNTDQSAFIFNTIQNYTVESTPLTDYEIKKAKFFNGNYHLMLKMVRGAYIDEEREIGKQKHKEICWASKEETDHAYNNNVLSLLKADVENKKICVATHNVNSFELAKNCIEQREIDNTDNNIRQKTYFATLFGLNDNLTYRSLGFGFKTVKYIPYGENDITLPYLIRRGKECQDLIKNSDEELKSLKNEILGRLTFRR